MLTKGRWLELEEAEPKDRVEELEEARSFLAGARQYVDQADGYLERALQDGQTELYAFPALINLDLVENCVRAVRKDLRSRRFVDA